MKVTVDRMKVTQKRGRMVHKKGQLLEEFHLSWIRLFQGLMMPRKGMRFMMTMK
jgi:hypothetical protein